MKIGLKLLQLRKQFRFSQEYVADEIGISKTTLRKWETAESIPTFENLSKLSQFYNVKMTYWFEENNDVESDEVMLHLNNLLHQVKQLINEIREKQTKMV